jgi:hypothetical protein
MGQTAPAQSFFGKVLGTGNDCSQYLTWLTNAGCWGYTPSEWATEMAYGNILPTLAKGASTEGVIDYSNPSSLVTGTQEDPQAAISAAITDQTLLNQAANLLAVQAAPNASTCSTSIIQGVCDWIVYALAAAALVGVALIGSRR